MVEGNAEVGDRVDKLLGRPENRDPILDRDVLIGVESTDPNYGCLVDCHEYLIQTTTQLSIF